MKRLLIAVLTLGLSGSPVLALSSLGSLTLTATGARELREAPLVPAAAPARSRRHEFPGALLTHHAHVSACELGVELRTEAPRVIVAASHHDERVRNQRRRLAFRGSRQRGQGRQQRPG